MPETSTIDTRDTRGVTRLPTHDVDATRVEGVYAEGKGLKSTFLEGHDPSDGDVQDAVDKHFEAGAEEVRVDHVVVANTTFSEEGDEHDNVITRSEYEGEDDDSLDAFIENEDENQLGG